METVAKALSDLMADGTYRCKNGYTIKAYWHDPDPGNKDQGLEGLITVLDPAGKYTEQFTCGAQGNAIAREAKRVLEVVLPLTKPTFDYEFLGNLIRINTRRRYNFIHYARIESRVVPGEKLLIAYGQRLSGEPNTWDFFNIIDRETGFAPHGDLWKAAIDRDIQVMTWEIPYDEKRKATIQGHLDWLSFNVTAHPEKER